MGRIKEGLGHFFEDDAPLAPPRAVELLSPNYPKDPGFMDQEASRDAAKAMGIRVQQLHEDILGLLRGLGPRTADELAAALGKSIMAIRPRVTELGALGKIRKSGRRGTNKSGLTAAIWELVP